MRNLLLLSLFNLIVLLNVAQAPPGYYSSTYLLSGNDLKVALFDIIKNHTVRDYTVLWTYFPSTDVNSAGKVWDMYSDNPSGTDPYVYTFGTNQCGNYSSEGDCYNREHSFPKSWFNDGTPMISDLFHIYPTDGAVNGKRSNYPYGVVTSPTWTSLNGSKLGNCSYPGYSGVVFEPIDEYKGDFARSYFYMMVRYMNVTPTWVTDMMTGGDLSIWAENMLLDWSTNDPVSQKEIDRNNEVYAIQNNRNPFIDHPEWANFIWGPTASIQEERSIDVSILNFNNILTIKNKNEYKGTLQLIDMLGKVVLSESINNVETKIELNQTSGIYISVFTCAEGRFSRGVMVE